MRLDGYTDFASASEIRGWVYDSDRPDDALTVQVYSGPVQVTVLIADAPRSDLLAAGKGNGKHAFSFSFDSGQSELPLVARVGEWLIPLGSFLSPSKYQGKFNHSLERGLPVVETAFSRKVVGDDDGAIVERLINAYQRALADSPKDIDAPKDLWSAQMDAGHREFAELLGRGDMAGVGAYLADAHAKSLTNGITQGDTVTAILRARSDARERVAGPFVDYLVSLAEFLGILNLECSDQAAGWGENLYHNPQGLIDRIGAELDIDVVPPQVMNSQFGIATVRGVVSGRDLMSLHTAIRLREIARNQVFKEPEVCEIGGGLGGVAYYATRLGVRRYTIIDLPIVNVLQGYFLLNTLPECSVQLYGESLDASCTVSILPTNCFADEAVQFDILLNQDSMPEIHPEFSIGYLRSSAKKRKHFFLSVNQEARAVQTADSVQTVVSDLVKQAGGYVKVSRNRHWIRPGYVEEVYRSV